MSTITWLHISDLHLRVPTPPEPEPDPLPYDVNVVLRSFLDDLAERIAQDGLRPDFIAVTGDLAYSGKAAEYALARRFFDDLLAVTGLDKDRLFLAPGNHDADRARISRGARGIAASLTDRDSVNGVLAEPESCGLLFDRLQGYAGFVRSYLGDAALPDARGVYVRALEVGGQQVALLGLNSAWLAQGGEADYGQLALGERLVRGALDRAVGADLAIALLHHPFAWLKKFEQEHSQALLCRECDFILHGHLHQSGLTFQRDPDAEATVIGAGALYETRDYPNGYNLVQLDLAANRGRVVLRAWVDRRGGFWTADSQTYRNVKDGVYTFPFGAPPSPPPVAPRPPESPIPSLPIPNLPTPYFAHPYPLQENFTGRVAEREMLSDWWCGGRRPVLAVVALGGMGKSALTWAWLQRDVLGQTLPGQAAEPPELAARCRLDAAQRPEGVLWWSFYEPEAKFAAFLAEALLYASEGQIDPTAVPGAHERLRWLLALLQQRRLLLVLDGFERELRAYAGLSAAYQGDEVDEDREDQFRACIDPHAAAFLRAAAALPMRGRLLLTSRLFPKELDGLAGCRRWELRRLQPDDAVAFFHAQGVRGTRAEIQAACQPYGYHPLALRLLAGLIVRDPARPGDVAAAAEYDVADDLTPREHHILRLAYDALRPGLRALLSRLAAFRAPVAYDVAAALSPFEGKRELGRAMRELEERGLLFREQEAAGTARYDLHPVVRGYAYHRLADKAGVHGQLRDYFAAVPAPDEEAVKCVADLAPLIELYHHTVRAGRYDEAWTLFRDRFWRTLYYRFGAYQTQIELLRALFPDGEDESPRLADEADQAHAMNELANAHSLSGQPRRAAPLFEASNAVDEKRGSKVGVAIGLGNLAHMAQLPLGELAAAGRSLRRSVELCREIGDEFQEAVGHQELGRLLACRGAFDEAAAELETALTSFGKQGARQSECVVWAYRALGALLLGDAAAALEAARRARELADEVARTRYPYERDIIRAEWLLGLALVALARLDEAEPHLTPALDRCRRINLVESEPDILLAWARWHDAKGNKDQARQLAEEALAIAGRCEYRLVQAEVHNFLARWHLEGGNTQDAHRHAGLARERAWCDGPPHCYRPALDEAERLLAAAG